MNPAFVQPVEMLPMPKADTLTEGQLDGKVCVWCGVRPREPLALGVRLSVLAGRLHRWLPISHRRCAAEKAGKTYELHRRTCARCAPRDYCPDAVALYELSQTA